jgi:cyclohexyl-isocyanide hydratase
MLPRSHFWLIVDRAPAGCAASARVHCCWALLDLLRGYRAAVHWGAREALSQFGAEPSDERVCVDRNRLTGGGITAGVDFGIKVAGQWAGESTGESSN